MRRRPATPAESVALGRMLLARDRLRARPLMQTLERCGQPTLKDLRRLSGAPLVDLLLRISYRLRFEDPEAMVTFAGAACKAAELISTRRYGREVLSDLRGRAWVELANAYRAAGRFQDAGPAFSRSRGLLGKGSGCPALLARFGELLGTYLADLRKLSDAEEYLEAAADLYAELGLQQESHRARLGLAHILIQAYEPERAAVNYLRVLGVLDGGSPYRLTAIHGLTLSLVEAGHAAVADQLLRSNKRLYQRSGRLNKIRLFWLEGKVAKGLGRYGEADGKLNTARLAFARANQIYDSALVSLDLAWIYARQGRHQETIWLVESMIETFRGLGIAREALASLLLLKKSCEQRKSAENLTGQIEGLVRVMAELSCQPTATRRS